MFKWRKESYPGGVTYILESDQFPVFAHVGIWNNPDENNGKWYIHVGREVTFVSGSIETAQRIAQHIAILHLSTAIQEISSLSL